MLWNHFNLISRKYLFSFKYQMEFPNDGRPITIEEASSLHQLLFGNTDNFFHSNWTNQSFKFRGDPEPYGLVQNRSGPCGVIAAVQAHVLYELLYGFSRNTLKNNRLSPCYKEKQEALARALSSILWQAGGHKKVNFAIKSNMITLNTPDPDDNILNADGVLEYLRILSFRSKDSLLDYIYKYISLLMLNGSSSCVTLLYSAILSHGIENVKEDMDDQTSVLIGSDGYCSQEIVNLMLVGRASANVFDGDQSLDFGGDEDMLLRGIPKRSKIGFLSEYDDHETPNLKVGTFYRYPEYPIWVIFGRYHYSVLFATTREIFDLHKCHEQFNLYYVDSMAVYEGHNICLTPIAETPTDFQFANNHHHIYKCIQARWPKCKLNNVRKTQERESIELQMNIE